MNYTDINCMERYQTFPFQVMIFLLIRAKSRAKSPFAQKALLEKRMFGSVTPGIMRTNVNEFERMGTSGKFVNLRLRDQSPFVYLPTMLEIIFIIILCVCLSSMFA